MAAPQAGKGHIIVVVQDGNDFFVRCVRSVVSLLFESRPQLPAGLTYLGVLRLFGGEPCLLAYISGRK
jgi:hypothetical protein